MPSSQGTCMEQGNAVNPTHDSLAAMSRNQLGDNWSTMLREVTGDVLADTQRQVSPHCVGHGAQCSVAYV